MPHTFDTCPLRCYSLLIVDSKTQKIVLATKEICTLLGYLPSQLIGHSLTVLNLQQLDEHHCVFRHESSHSRVAFKVCTHYEPILGLNCWCLHAVSPALQWNNTSSLRGKMDIPSNMNIVRLDSHGVIEYCTENEGNHSMMGQSLQSFIHLDDRQRLVDGLNERRQTTYQVLFLRLQVLDDETCTADITSKSGTYQWISLTMLTVPKRRSYGGAHYDDPSSRQQLVIIRPATNPHPNVLSSSSSSSPSPTMTTTTSSSLFIIWSLRGLQVMRIMFGFCLGVTLEAWFTTWDTLYQGQRYLVEFLAHLLISVLDFLADCIDPAPSSTSSVRVVLGHEELQKQKQEQKNTDDNNDNNSNNNNKNNNYDNKNNNEETTLITEVPWLRPLHRKRWATAVRTLRRHVQSNTMAQKSLGVLETIGVVQSANMFDYLEKVTSDRNQPPLHHPPIKDKLC